MPFLGVFYAVIIMLALLFTTRTNKKRSRHIIVPKDSEPDEKFEEVSLHEGDGIHGEPNIEAVSSSHNRGKSIEIRGAEV